MSVTVDTGPRQLARIVLVLRASAIRFVSGSSSVSSCAAGIIWQVEVLRASSADEMVACYLAGEITSERFGDAIRAQLTARGLDEGVVTTADLSDGTGNRWRNALLAATRGWGEDREMFTHFPNDVSWMWASLHPRELARVRYIEYSYWNEISGGSRLPVDAARRIDEGLTAFNVPNARFERLADALRAGATFPPLILAGPTSDNLVCLEGHLRLTAYALARFPNDLTCLIAVDARLTQWAE
jgi:hypothetical protein